MTKTNNIEKAYDFGASEFNRKMKRITQERLKRGFQSVLIFLTMPHRRNLKNSRHSMRGQGMVSLLRIDPLHRHYVITGQNRSKLPILYPRS